LINTGTIKNGRGGPGAYAIYSTGSIASVANSGQIDGAVLLGAGGASFTNAALGSITGNLTFSGSSNRLENDGRISGSVMLGAGNTLTNAGDIQGAVTMGAADTFDFAPGGVVGAITASNADLFEFSGKFGAVVIDNFQAGTGATHDTLAFATSDLGGYAAVQSAMSQVGANVVIRLDATDTITLVDVSLSSLGSADFKSVTVAPTQTAALGAGGAPNAGVTLFGQYAAAGMSAAHDGGSGGVIPYARPPAPRLELAVSPHWAVN
jgi:hypothetical protein